jgi:hypothetical protein
MLQQIPIQKSRHLAGVTYDDETMILSVTFSNDRIYSYFHVTGDIANGFSQALSAGQYFDVYIKGKFEHAEDNE